MRGFKRSPRLFGLGVLLAIPVLFGGQASADVHTDQGGSLIVFPKVVADGTRDTIIKITNKSNMATTAHCIYINALGTCSTTSDQTCMADDDCPTGEACDSQCPENDFVIALTAQQPTFWRASTGRQADLTAPACQFNQDCSCTVDMGSGALVCPGFPPTLSGGIGNVAVQGVGNSFNGELRCYQTDPLDAETPIGQNSLIGEAVLVTLDSGAESQYNAITVASPSNGPDDDLDLMLDNADYNACPDSLVFTHYGEGGTELATGAEVNTELTLVPCTVLYSIQQTPSALVHYRVTDQTEFTLSADARAFDCHLSRTLSRIDGIFNTVDDATNLLKTRVLVDDSRICLTGDDAGSSCNTNADCDNALTSDSGLVLGCAPSSGVLGVVEEFYDGGIDRPAGSAAFNVINEGARESDVISVPPSNP